MAGQRTGGGGEKAAVDQRAELVLWSVGAGVGQTRACAASKNATRKVPIGRVITALGGWKFAVVGATPLVSENIPIVSAGRPATMADSSVEVSEEPEGESGTRKLVRSPVVNSRKIRKTLGQTRPDQTPTTLPSRTAKDYVRSDSIPSPAGITVRIALVVQKGRRLQGQNPDANHCHNRRGHQTYLYRFHGRSPKNPDRNLPCDTSIRRSIPLH